MIRILVFDFDGVLADSVCIKDSAFYDLIRPYGEAYLREARRFWDQSRGQYRPDRIKNAFWEILGLELSPEDLQKKVNQFISSAIENTILSPWIPGAIEFLKGSSQYKKYIVSAAPHDEIQMVAEKKGAACYFKGIFGSPVKKSQHLFNIQQIENVKEDEVLFLGDALADYHASKVANVRFIGVVSEKRTNPFPHSVRTIKDLTELQPFLS